LELSFEIIIRTALLQVLRNLVNLLDIPGSLDFRCDERRRPHLHYCRSAPSKAWQRGIPRERMKPFDRIQRWKSSPARAVAGRAGSESYLSSGDGRERNVDSEQVGREGLASKFIGLRMPRLFWSKAISMRYAKNMRGRASCVSGMKCSMWRWSSL